MHESVRIADPAVSERVVRMRSGPNSGYYPYAPKQPADTVDIWGTLDVFRRRKGLLLVVATLLLALFAFVVFRLTPVYQASAVVMASDQGANLLNMSQNTNAFPDPEAVQSEVQILSSRTLAEEVMAKLDLTNDPEFNPKKGGGEKKPMPLLGWFFDLLGQMKAALSPPPPFVVTNTSEAENTAILQGFQRKLSVEPVGRSRALRITFQSTSPVTAATIANAVADSYRQRKVDTQTTAYQNTILWVTAQLNEAEQKLNQSRTKLADARKDALDSDDPSSSDAVLRSPLIQSLRTQQAVLEQRIANLQATYGSDYPDLQAARSELASLKATINSEIGKIMHDLTGGSDRLRDTIDEKPKKGAKKGNDTVAVLEREVAAQDALYTDLLSRSKRLEVERGVQWGIPEMLSRADVPAKAFFPNKPILLLLGSFLSLIAGAAVAFLVEKRNMTIMTTQQAERSLAVNALGLIPTVAPLTTAHGHFNSASIIAKQDANSVFSESIRNLHVKLVLHHGGPPKTVMMSSAVPGEGKSSVALALSLLIAGTGRRVVVVDCDIRRPRIHSAFGLSVGPGLTDYLRGRVELDVACRHQSELQLDVITAGQSHSHPADLLSSARMNELLERLKATYDMVIIDAPPVQAVADALVLAPHIDTTVFLVHWGKTPEQVAARAVAQLGAAGADIAGVVLTRVDVGKVMRDRLEDYYSYGALDYARTA